MKKQAAEIIEPTIQIRPNIMHLFAVLTDGTKPSGPLASTELQNTDDGAVVPVANDGACEAGSFGVAIGGYDCTAKAGKYGLAQVLRGTAIVSGERPVAISRASGDAQASGDGAVAIAMSGGIAMLIQGGIAIALNDRNRYDTRAVGKIGGGWLIFGYYPDDTNKNSPMEFVAGRIGSKQILPDVTYRVDSQGKIVPA